MEESKNLCIYTNKDDTQAHFKNQEHIVPACIGGMKKLPKGYVSDEVNTLFSGLELKLARNSPITLVRMFVGPGKRGSHNPKRRGGASKIVSVMQSDETGEYSLGYMRVGVPITIDQIHIVYLEGGKRQTSFRFDTETVDEDHFQERVAEWIHELAEFDSQATILQKKEMPENEFSGIVDLQMPHKGRNHVTSDIRQEIDLYAYYRVVAKIAFNCLAEVRGREYVMQQKFAPVRESILTGKDIEQMVMMPGKKNPHAEVMLYGDANPMFVVLSEEDCRDFGEMDGYVCDWENRREMRFLDYLGEITREDSEPYEWDDVEE